MTLRIQTFYPEAGLFLNTNHTSSDLEELKTETLRLLEEERASRRQLSEVEQTLRERWAAL